MIYQYKWCFSIIGASPNDLSLNDLPNDFSVPMIFQSKWFFSPNDFSVQMIFPSKWSQSKWSQSKQFPSPNDPSPVDPSPINPSLNDSGPFILVVKSLKRETFQWLALLAGQRCCLLRHFFRSERLAGGQKAAPLLSSGDGSAWQDCCSTQKLKAFSFRTGRLTRKRFHRFLCIIVSTAFYRPPCWSRCFLPHQPWQEMPYHSFFAALFILEFRPTGPLVLTR